MAEQTMTSAYVYGLKDNLTVLPGEKIVVEILNSDGTVKQEICNLVVPAGKKMDGRAVYSGSVS